MPDDLTTVFLETSATRLSDTVKTLGQCLDRLTDEQVWHRSGPHENAIGKLVLHLCGNMRQWVIHGVGNQPDVRARDAEFAACDGHTRAELLTRFQSTVDETNAVIRSVSPTRLLEIVHPQGRTVTAFEAIYHVVTHAHQHIGQIVFVTKQLTATDLDLTLPRPR